MAFLAPTQDDDDKKQDQQDDVGPAGGQVLGAPSAAPLQGSGSSVAPAAGPRKPTKSGNWTNLNTYLEANKGAGTQMAGKVEGKVQEAHGQATTAGQGYDNAATQQIQSGTVQQDAGTMSELDKIAKGERAKLDRDRLTGQLHAEYKGPKAATQVEGQDANAVAGKYNVVDTYGDAAGGGQGGRSYLAEETFGKSDQGSRYRGGERNFDAFLMGVDGSNTLGKINSTYKDTNDQWKGVLSAIGDKIKGGQATTTATRKATQDAIGRAQGTLSEATTAAEARQAAANAENDKIAKALESGDFSGAGLTQADVDWIKSHGDFDFARLMNAGKGYSAADFMDDTSLGNYQDLFGALGGADANFTTRLGGQAAGWNQDLAAKIKRAEQSETFAKEKTDDLNARRRAEVDENKSAFSKSLESGDSTTYLETARRLGMSEDDARVAFLNGVDLGQFVNYGGDAGIGYGDFGGNENVMYSQLMRELGLDNALSASLNQAGGGMSFDKAGAAAAIKSILDEAGEDHRSYLSKRMGEFTDQGKDVGTTVSDELKKADPRNWR